MLIIVNHQILRISKLIHATHSLFPFNASVFCVCGIKARLYFDLKDF